MEGSDVREQTAILHLRIKGYERSTKEIYTKSLSAELGTARIWDFVCCGPS